MGEEKLGELLKYMTQSRGERERRRPQSSECVLSIAAIGSRGK
jgi:hypothetical protein